MAFTDEQVAKLTAKHFARFWSHVRVTSDPAECWEWTANDTRGYGHFSVDGQTVIATRWIYSLVVGEIPDGLQICHHCDNPPCVNPAHLYAGTPAQNIRDKFDRGRADDRKGERHPMARMTADKVSEIRRQAAMGVVHAQIAEDFGISRQHVGKIVRKENWQHV